MSKLYFRYGTMNSGKSIEILRVAHNYTERGMSPLLLKPTVDTLGDNKVHSRVGISQEAHLVYHDDDLSELYKDCDCILVDEAQFLTEQQVDQLMTCTLHNTPVLCYGLRTDFTTHMFSGSKRLMEIAHSIEEIKTICMCGNKATISARVDSYGSIIIDGEQVHIENLDDPQYVSLCAQCYNKQTHMWD